MESTIWNILLYTQKGEHSWKYTVVPETKRVNKTYTINFIIITNVRWTFINSNWKTIDICLWLLFFTTHRPPGNIGTKLVDCKSYPTKRKHRRCLMLVSNVWRLKKHLFKTENVRKNVVKKSFLSDKITPIEQNRTEYLFCLGIYSLSQLHSYKKCLDY